MLIPPALVLNDLYLLRSGIVGSRPIVEAIQHPIGEILGIMSDPDDFKPLFEVPLASEVSNLLNFLILDVVVLPFIMHMSSRLAGFTNNRILQNTGIVTLVEFDNPFVGGGLVMPKSWRRTLFILLRVSVVVAVAISNFGLEGRTRQAFVTRQGVVRVPGILDNPNSTITGVVMSQMRCHHRVSEETIVFGSIIDGVCYPRMTDFAVVRNWTTNKQMNSSALHCQAYYNCDNIQYPTTTYRCDSSDIVCTGVPENSGCSNQRGIRKNTFGDLKCHSISYDPENDLAWVSNKESMMPGTVTTLHECIVFNVKREYVQLWNETFPRTTFLPGKALFASAYGAEKRTQVTVPSEKRPVTGVRLRWVLSVAWVFAVALLLSLWVYFFVHQGFKETIHDECGLLGLAQTKTGHTGGFSFVASKHGRVALSTISPFNPI